MDRQFKAMVVREDNGKFSRKIEEKNISDLPDREVLINVKYSALNYKDALSATGNKGVSKFYPHTPGIDAAGIVAESKVPEYKEGDEVLVTGYDLGMNTPGGFGEYISVPAAWVVKLPERLTLKESMILGTAGFTAALSLYKLELNGLTKESGDVLVTGASGGVGSVAVAILSCCGYNVTAVTGKDEEAYLRRLGAKNIIKREEFLNHPGKPLLSGKWGAAIDTVGGSMLETVIASLKMSGSAAVCGNVLSAGISTTVFPFILRGVNILGINSAETNYTVRMKVWENLSGRWKPGALNEICEEHSLAELDNDIDLMMKGKTRGRIVINMGM
jgi:putative YhdH/YhfP family quinone oxidoreductase